MNIIISGSSGTIGTALCEALGQHHRVIPVDLRPNRWNVGVNAETVIVDLRSMEEFRSLPADVDLVIHCAANARVYDLVVDPELAFDNILTTKNVMEYMRRNNVPRIIFASSREVYGSATDDSPISEEMVDLTRCESPYAASKIAGESLVSSYSRAYGMKFVILRLSNVYGRYDDSNRVVPTWIQNALTGAPLTVFGPEKRLDFTYLNDVVKGISRVVETFENINGRSVNISSGSSESLLSVARMVREFINSSSKIEVRETRKGEITNYTADLSTARRLLNYDPVFDIKTGLRKTINWYKDYYG